MSFGISNISSIARARQSRPPAPRSFCKQPLRRRPVGGQVDSTGARASQTHGHEDGDLVR
eukprot:3109045-Pyramimonas_sp.AAC.1